MATWIIVAIVIVALIAVVLIAAALRPSSFRVSRSIVIAAPPDAIYPHVDSFPAWKAWSPFETMDADLDRTYSGSPNGVGARYAWKGRKSGSGAMEIIDVTPPNRVLIDLHFTAPFKADNKAEFTILPAANGTEVTWTMTGNSPFMMKVMGIVMSMDGVVGGQFAQGLAKLKGVVETPNGA